MLDETITYPMEGPDMGNRFIFHLGSFRVYCSYARDFF